LLVSIIYIIFSCEDKIMSKVGQDNVELSPRAEGILKDINSLPGRVSSYKDSIAQLKPTTAEERILYFDAHLSVIEGLGSKAIRENSPASTIDSLIDAIHESNKAYSKFANDVDKAKLNVNAAKTEAALKGFVLPLSIGGPSNELESFGLDRDEYKIAMQATKTAILELANKHISKEEYAEEIRKRTQEILKSDPQAFSPEKLEQFDKFIGQGKQIQKPSKLTNPELEAIALATAKSVDSLSNTIIKDTQSVPSILLVNDVIKQMEKQHKVKLTPERVEKLMKNLVPTLTKLGPEYLEDNKAVLTKELSDSLKAGQTTGSKFFSRNYTIASKDLGEIARKIDETHQPQADALIKAAKVAPEEVLEPKAAALIKAAKVAPEEVLEPKAAALIKAEEVAPPAEVLEPKAAALIKAEEVAPPAEVLEPQAKKLPPPRTVVTVAEPDHAKGIIEDSINQLQTKNRVKFTPEKIAALTKTLTPALAKFSPEYMETHKLKLTRELSSSLRSGQGFISQATGTYNISNRELEKITNKMDKASQEVSNTTVKNAIREREMSNPDITVKLNAFAKETGGETFYKAPTIEDIAKIRLSNPKKFDQIFNAPKPLSPDLNAPPKSTKTKLSSYLEQKRTGQGQGRSLK